MGSGQGRQVDPYSEFLGGRIPFFFYFFFCYSGGKGEEGDEYNSPIPLAAQGTREKKRLNTRYWPSRHEWFCNSASIP